MKREIEVVVGLDCSEAIMASAKQGIGIEEILEAVVRRIPAPADNRGKPLRALIFDSYYDSDKVRLALLPGAEGCGRLPHPGVSACASEGYATVIRVEGDRVSAEGCLRQVGSGW